MGPSKVGPHLTGPPRCLWLAMLPASNTLVGEGYPKALRGDTPRPTPGHTRRAAPSTLWALFPDSCPCLPHSRAPTCVSRSCTDRPRPSIFWLTKVTMACPQKNADPRLRFAPFPLGGQRARPSPHSPQQVWPRAQFLPAVTRGTGWALISLTSFTAFTFSGASLNNSSKMSSADRPNKHLITMLLSLSQTGTFFHQSFSE